MGGILPQGKTQYLSDTGAPLAGGSVYCYAQGTTSYKDTWKDSSYSTKNTNPVILDASGSAVIWGAGAYTIVVKNAGGVQISSTDVVAPAAAGAAALANWAALDALHGVGVGDTYVLDSGQLGSPETVKIVAAGTYTADGVLVRNLTASGLQAVSTRQEYASYAEFDADPRGLASGQFSILSDQVYGAYVSTGQTLTTTAGTKVIFWNALTVNLANFGIVGDGVTDDTLAIQAAMNYIRDLYFSSAALAYRKLVFPPRPYKISASILLPFAGASSNTIPTSGTTEILGYGTIIIGSGSLSTDHDGFVSAYYNGTQNLPTLGTVGESTLTYGVKVKGFAFKKVRRAFELQNWNAGCRVSDIQCSSVQSAVYGRRCFDAQFENINSNDAPDEQGSNIVVASGTGFAAGQTVTGGTSGDTAIIERVDVNTLYVKTITGGFEAGETLTSSGGASSTVSSFNPIGNFDFSDFVNVQPLRSCVGGSHDININIGGAAATTLYDCNGEGAQIGVFVNSECDMLTIISPYWETNAACAIYAAAVIRQLNINGAFINQGSAKFIKSNVGSSGYCVVNFNNCNLYSGDFSMPANVYGYFHGDGISSYPLTGSKTINMSPQPIVDLALGYVGPTRITDWDHSTGKNPGFYHSTFGDDTGGLSNNYPYQTLTTAAGTSSGTKWTFDTEINAEFNVMGTWYLRWSDAITVHTKVFLIMAETADGAGSATTYHLYERNTSTNALTDTSVTDPNFTATQNGGKLRLIADNLNGPALSSSIVRVL